MVDLNRITGAIVDAAFKIHVNLGPGTLESVYHPVLCRELQRRGFFIESKKPISFDYQGMRIEKGFTPDIIVERAVVVEVKSVAANAPVHEKQLLSYLRILDLRLGLLLNFNVPYFRNGIKRIINGF